MNQIGCYKVLHAISRNWPLRAIVFNNNKDPLMTKPASSTWSSILIFLLPPEVRGYDMEGSQIATELMVSKKVSWEGRQMLREKLTDRVSQRRQCQGSAWDSHSPVSPLTGGIDYCWSPLGGHGATPHPVLPNYLLSPVCLHSCSIDPQEPCRWATQDLKQSSRLPKTCALRATVQLLALTFQRISLYCVK